MKETFFFIDIEGIHERGCLCKDTKQTCVKERHSDL